MHTLELSLMLDSRGRDYNNILNKFPFYTPRRKNVSRVKRIHNLDIRILDKSKLNMTDELKKETPLIKLYRFREIKRDNMSKKIYQVRVNYMMVLVINIGEILGGSGNTSIDSASIKELICYALYNHILDILPQLECMINIKQEFNSTIMEYRNERLNGDENLSIEDVIRKILTSNDREAYHIIESYGLRKDYVNISDKNLMKTIYSLPKFYPDFKLRRIDYSYDLSTEFKDIYLKLISKGYEPRGLRMKMEIFENMNNGSRKIVSEYGISKSVRINIYDKVQQLVDTEKVMDEMELDRLKDILRIEIQILKPKLNVIIQRKSKELGIWITERTLVYFCDADIECYILNNYLSKLVGKGHYFTLDLAREIINGSNFKRSKKNKLVKVLEGIAKYHGIEKFLDKIDKNEIKELPIKRATAMEYLKEIESLNVNPVFNTKYG